MKLLHLLKLKSSYWSINLPRVTALYYSTASTAVPVVTGKYDSLYRRLTPIGDWSTSIVPVLDQWIEEGRSVTKAELQRTIREFRRYKRFKHALEVSQWMSDKRYFQLSRGDMAVRLDLISKANGIDEAVTYFNSIPEQKRDVEVYGALLNCYAREENLEKAEVLVQKMRNLKLAIRTVNYNVMLNLYSKTGNYEKMRFLLHEIEEEGIKGDRVTVGIQLTACSASCDTEGMDVIIKKMESEAGFVLDWKTYYIAANGYMKAGCLDKALVMLKKSERLVLSSERKSIGFDYLLTQYTAMGNKAEVLRLWELYKKMRNIYNSGYLCMISSLLKFDDVRGAEYVFEEWESNQLTYDFRIPNLLIGYYCRKGLIREAEALLDRTKKKDRKPLPQTWYYFATGYVGCGELPKAIEAMKRAMSECGQGWHQPDKDILIACLDHMKQSNNVEEAEEFIRSLGGKDIISGDIEKKLLNYFGISKEDSDSNRFIEGDLAVQAYKD